MFINTYNAMRKSYKKNKDAVGKQWKIIIDFTKIKNGGVDIKEILAKL